MPTQKPVEQELQPEQAEPETEQAGSATGTDLGSAEGMEGRQRRRPGRRRPGRAVLGGCVGGTGDGAVLDYDQAPELDQADASRSTRRRRS